MASRALAGVAQVRRAPPAATSASRERMRRKLVIDESRSKERRERMPHIVVTAETSSGRAGAMLAERVRIPALEGDEADDQLSERVGWTVADAAEPRAAGPKAPGPMRLMARGR